MKKLTLNLLKLYQKYLSPINFGKHTCRFEPSCSYYTYEAIEHYGMLKGSLMGAWRVLRCNPLSKGGYEPVVRGSKSSERSEVDANPLSKGGYEPVIKE